MIAFASSLDCPGPVARDVTDAALMLQVIAGPDPRDSTAANVPVPDYLAALEKGVKGMRIGLSPDYFRITFPDPGRRASRSSRCPPRSKRRCAGPPSCWPRWAPRSSKMCPCPTRATASRPTFVISRVEAASNLHRYDGVKYGYRTPEPVDDLREMYKKSRAAGLWPAAQAAHPDGHVRQRRAVQRAVLPARPARAHADPPRFRRRPSIRNGPYRLDALLTPTTPTTAFAIGAVYGDSVLMQYADQLTVPANHAGVPGISVPAGLDAAGLPIGIQLLGPDFSEATLLRIGRAYEQATQDDDWRKVLPQVLKA